MHRDQPPIRRRPDGAIDTAFYTARGRRMRGEQAHRLAGALAPGPGRIIARLLTLPASAAQRLTQRQSPPAGAPADKLP